MGQSTNGITQDICDQVFIAVVLAGGGGNCSLCCIVSTILTEIQEGLFATSQLCEGLVDSRIHSADLSLASTARAWAVAHRLTCGPNSSVNEITGPA